MFRKVWIVKTAAKGVVGIVFSAAIGYAIKLERKIEERVDDYYDPEPKTDQDN